MNFLEEDELIENLCIHLRHVGCGDRDLPNNERVIRHILEVQNISKILNSKGTNPSKRLKLLTKETSWLMEELYQDCLNYPNIIPYVKLLNGQERIEIIKKEIDDRKKKQDEEHNKFINTTGKDLTNIINKYINNDKKKKELIELLKNCLYRHLAVELVKIRSATRKEESEIINSFYESVF